MPKLRPGKTKNRYVVDARDIGAGEPRFKSRGEALAWIEKSTHENYSGVFVDPAKSVTFAKCVEVYLDAQRIAQRDNTIGLAELNNRIRNCNHFLALDWNNQKFADVKVTDIRMGILKNVILEQIKKKWSKATCQKMLVHLKGVFAEAKLQDYIRENPATELRIGRKGENVNDIADAYRVEDISALTNENVIKLLGAAEGQYYLIIKTCAMTGMRSSEQVALTWDQIDFGDNENAGRLFIDKALKRTEGVVGKPKTAAGQRLISLQPELRRDLMKHKLAQSPEEAKNNLVFPTTGKVNKRKHSDLLEGNLSDYGNWRKRGLYPACKKAGIPQISFRMLRHYYASILIFDLDESEAMITQEMGHTDISFTKRQYATWLKKRSRDEEVARKKGEAFAHLNARGE